MSNFRRRLLTASSLKPEWTPVDYLYSENTKGEVGYIDTGIKPDFYTNVECTFWLDRSYINYIANIPIFGASANFSYILRQGNNMYISTINNDIKLNGVETHYPGDTKVHYKRVDNEVMLNQEGPLIHTETAKVSTSNLCLMNIREIGWLNPQGGIRIGSFKITQGDTLLRDFIPMTNGDDTAMYDTVSKEMFYKIIP